MTDNQTPERTSLRAGVAKSDITTTDPDRAVHDPLYARALVLDDGTTTVALVGMDVVAIGGICDVPDEFLPQVRARIEQEVGIPGAHVLVNASHTHPPGRILCPDAELVDRVCDAVRRAQAHLTPVQVGVGRGHEDRFTINRTMQMKDGSAWTIRHAHPLPPDEEVAALNPTDPEIGVLRFDRLDGTPLAAVFNFGCHPLMGYNGGAVTANFPGVAAQVIEDNLGHGAMALFLQGAGGDVCDIHYKDHNRPRNASLYGMMLGLSALQALHQVQTGPGSLKVVTEHIQLPRRTDIPQRLEDLKKLEAELVASLAGTSLTFRAFLPLYLKYALNPDFPADYSYGYLHDEAIGREDLKNLDADNRNFIAKYLQSIRTMERIGRIQDDMNTLRWHQNYNDASGEDTIAGEVMGLRIGECVLVTSPAEVLSQVCLNIKRQSPHEYTFLSAFSNGYVHYGSPASAYPQGGYEVTECLLAPEWQELYEATVRQVLAQL